MISRCFVRQAGCLRRETLPHTMLTEMCSQLCTAQQIVDVSGAGFVREIPETHFRKDCRRSVAEVMEAFLDVINICDQALGRRQSSHPDGNERIDIQVSSFHDGCKVHEKSVSILPKRSVSRADRIGNDVVMQVRRTRAKVFHQRHEVKIMFRWSMDPLLALSRLQPIFESTSTCVSRVVARRSRWLDRQKLTHTHAV